MFLIRLFFSELCVYMCVLFGICLQETRVRNQFIPCMMCRLNFLCIVIERNDKQWTGLSPAFTSTGLLMFTDGGSVYSRLSGFLEFSDLVVEYSHH